MFHNKMKSKKKKSQSQQTQHNQKGKGVVGWLGLQKRFYDKIISLVITNGLGLAFFFPSHGNSADALLGPVNISSPRSCPKYD